MRPRRKHSIRRSIIVSAGMLAAACSPSNSTMEASSIEHLSETGQMRGSVSPAGIPLMRVLIMEKVQRCAFAISGPYEILQGQEVIATGARLPRTAATLSDDYPGHAQIGEWHCQAGAVDVRPKQPGTLHLFFERDNGKEEQRRYGGLVRFLPRPRPGSSAGGDAAGAMDVLNVVDMEQYLPGVLHAELYADWHIEAYRVQAIAARTYALYQKHTQGRYRDHDVRATEASQVYRGIDQLPANSTALQATRDTRGIVCVWSSPLGEKIFCTYFSSACGGMTQDAANVFGGPSIPPLAGGVQCDFCRIGGQVYRWDPVRLSKSEVTRLFRRRFPQHARIGVIRTLSAEHTTADGRPLAVRVEGTGGEVIVDSYQFRLAMGAHRLRSNHFQIVDLGDAFAFQAGRGFGHGVGMCQWGTEGQARLGMKSSQILALYYPGSVLRRAY